MRERPTRTFVSIDGQIKTGQGALRAILVVGGSAATTIDLYDNTSAAGNPIFSGSAPAESVSPLIDLKELEGIPFQTGLYADITTTGGHAQVWYE